MIPLQYLSPVAVRALPLGLGYRRGKLREMHYAPAAIVVHTTGGGPIARATEDRFAAWRTKLDIPKGDSLRCAVALYTHVMDASGHYVIGQDGTIVQVVPESHAAWHVGGKGSRPYFTQPEAALAGPKYRWWRERWPGLKTPRELAGGNLWRPAYQPPGITHRIRSGFPIGTCNENTIGIEVVGPGPWTPEAWSALAMLCLDIERRRGLTLRRDTVISHSDAHPLSRTTPSGRPWDPMAVTWTWERFVPLLAEHRAPRVVA
jgi:hypothetical protein